MKKKDESTDQLVKDYLQQHPHIKKAMEIFNISNEEYRSSIQARYGQKLSVTKETITWPHGKK